AQDWWRHGHASNPAYHQVALHISLDRPPAPIELPDGRRALALELLPYLTAVPGAGEARVNRLEPCRAPQRLRSPAELLGVLDRGPGRVPVERVFRGPGIRAERFPRRSGRNQWNQAGTPGPRNTRSAGTRPGPRTFSSPSSSSATPRPAGSGPSMPTSESG